MSAGAAEGQRSPDLRGPWPAAVQSLPLKRSRWAVRSARFSWAWSLQLGLLVVLAAAPRLYRLGHENFWLDEVIEVRIASQPVGDIIRNYHPRASAARRDQAPLSFLLTHFFVGEQNPERSARLPAAIFGAATIPIFFLLAGMLLPPPVPLLAAVFLAVSPLHLWYSQDARWYAQWVFLMTLSYLALLRAWKTQGGRAWAAYVLCTLLGVYTFIFSFLVMGCQAISAWGLQRSDPAPASFPRRLAAAQLLIVFAAAPVLWMIATHLSVPTGSPRPITFAELPYTAFAYAAGFSLGPTLAQLHALPPAHRILIEHPIVIAVFAVFLPLLLLGASRLRRHPAAAAILLPWLCGPVLLVFALALVTNIEYEVRYTLAALPVFILLVALGVCTLRGVPQRALAAGAVLGSLCLSAAHYYWDPQYDKEDVRAAVARIMSEAPADAPVIVAGEVGEVVAYYGRDLRVVPAKNCSGEGGTVADEMPGRRLVGVPMNMAQAVPPLALQQTQGEQRFWRRHINPAHPEEAERSEAVSKGQRVAQQVSRTRVHGRPDVVGEPGPVVLVIGRDWEGEAEACRKRLAQSHVTLDRAVFTGVEVWFFGPRGGALS